MLGLGSLFSGIASVLSIVVTKLVPAIIKIVGVRWKNFLKNSA